MDPRYPRTGFFDPPILSGLGETIPCGKGFHNVCLLQRPGQPSTPDLCHCQADAAPSVQAYNQAASLVKFHWGLIAGIALASYFVFKIATR